MEGSSAVLIQCIQQNRATRDWRAEFAEAVSRSFHLIDVDGDKFVMSSELTFAALKWPEDTAREIFGSEEQFQKIVDADDLGTVTEEDFIEILI